jgi:hypothetical protein
LSRVMRFILGFIRLNITLIKLRIDGLAFEKLCRRAAFVAHCLKLRIDKWLKNWIILVSICDLIYWENLETEFKNILFPWLKPNRIHWKNILRSLWFIVVSDWFVCRSQIDNYLWIHIQRPHYVSAFFLLNLNHLMCF